MTDSSLIYNIPELVKREHENYEKLPRRYNEWLTFGWRGRAIKILSFSYNLMLEVTLIKPIIGLIVHFVLTQQMVIASQEVIQNLKPLAKERLKQREKQIQELAQKMGLCPSMPIKVFVAPMGVSASATRNGKNAYVVISSEDLIEPEDLPDHLNLEHVRSGKLSKEDWIIAFEFWHSQEFVPQSPSHRSKLGIDNRRKVELKTWLKSLLKNHYQREFDSVIGHELGHVACNHSSKMAIFGFLYNLASLYALGIPLLFKSNVTNYLWRRMEKEADCFSATHLGSAGLTSRFTKWKKAQAKLAPVYSEIYDEEGNSKQDEVHPSLKERLAYLQKMNIT